MNMPELSFCPLFANIEEKKLGLLMTCLGGSTRLYHKEDHIFEMGDIISMVGIVLSGGVHLFQDDFWGRRTILSHLEMGSLFGAAFSCTEQEMLPFSVAAAEDSKILLINIQKIMSTCSSACAFHTQLIMNLVQILSKKYIQLVQKVEHLSQKNIRGKLLSFLSYEAIRSGKNKINISFNRQELAEYLYVDRSALSRELSIMQSEGLLKYEKNYFELFVPPNYTIKEE